MTLHCQVLAAGSGYQMGHGWGGRKHHCPRLTGSAPSVQAQGEANTPPSATSEEGAEEERGVMMRGVGGEVRGNKSDLQVVPRMPPQSHSCGPDTSWLMGSHLTPWSPRLLISTGEHSQACTRETTSRRHRHTSSYCISLYCSSQVLHFLQTDGKTLRWQKDCNWLYCCGLEPNSQYLQGVCVGAWVGGWMGVCVRELWGVAG